MAAEWMGWENVFQVEWDDYCQKVLAKNFPNVKRYGDIKEFKGEAGSVDILTGGFPCQPFSHAGKRKGESDDRYLWPEYLRIIREIKPSYVVGENVAGLISMEDGKTLEGIFTDLEGEGYTVESFIIPACGVGAWHRRDRIWILAYTSDSTDRTNGGEKGEKESIQGKRGEAGYSREFSGTSPHEDVSNTGSEPTESIHSVRSKRTGLCVENKQLLSEGREQGSNRLGKLCEDVPDARLQRQKEHEKQAAGVEQCGEKDGNRKDVPHTDPKRLQGHGGLEQLREPDKYITEGNSRTRICGWESEPSVGRVANGIPNRVDRLKGLGNAIVPQVAYEIFKAINSL